MFGIHRNFPAGGGGGTGDATAEQWHIKNGKTAYIASGKVTGNAYTPAMMDFDGSTGYYSASFTSAGNLVSAVARFKSPSFTTGYRWVALCINSASRVRFGLAIAPSDAGTADERNKLVAYVQNSAGTQVCRLISSADVTDDAPHTIFFSYDGDTGVATFRLDGALNNAAASSHVAPVTATLGTGASSTVVVGSSAGGANKLNGEVGFFGHREAYLTNWSDFMRSDGSPIYQDPASSWAGSGFGAQPLFFNPHGDMANNLGSAGAMTKNGTINVGDGGAT